MAKKKKHVMSKEELRQPDVISGFFINQWKWINSHWKGIGLGIAGVGLVALGIAIYVWYAHGRDEKASRALDKSIDSILRPVDENSVEEKPMKGQRKAVKSLKDLFENSDKILTQSLKECGSSDVCSFIRSLRGRVSFEMAFIDKANKEKHLKAAISDLKKAYSGITGFGCASSLEALGMAKETLGDFNGALKVYRELTTAAGNAYAGQALIHQGRILELQGKIKEAKDLYKDIVKTKTTGSLEAQEKRLKGQLSYLKAISQISGGNNEKQMQQLMGYFRNAQASLQNLRATASISDPGYYAKQRLAFLDLGLSYESQEKKLADQLPPTDNKNQPPAKNSGKNDRKSGKTPVVK
ncbi:MAG: hypothetical protein JXR95_07700 [Deltaproteobacteria bacterium]|nr:hypothetical protein [Deltaproteobacteria bacterium]